MKIKNYVNLTVIFATQNKPAGLTIIHVENN